MTIPFYDDLGGSGSSLHAHHVNKKITKRMMDRRPKKSRPSDIFRNNVNHDKCITKLEGSPSDYTLIPAEGELAVILCGRYPAISVP
jgi:hypothetical protein